MFTAWLAVSIPVAISQIVNQIEQCTQVQSCEVQSIVALGLLLVVFRFFSRVFFFWPGRCVETDLRSNLFTRLLNLPLSFFESHTRGDLLSRLSNDVNHVRVFLAFGVLQFFNLSALASQALYKMFQVSFELAAVCLIPVFCILVVGRLGIPFVFVAAKQKQEALGKISDGVTEMYSHVQVIQSCQLEASFLSQNGASTERLYQAQMKDLMLNSIIYPLMTLFAQLAQVLIVWYGGYLVLQGRLTVGDILAFDQFIALLAFPLTAMGILFGIYQRLQVALQRLHVIHDAPIEKQLVSRRKAPIEPLLEVCGLTHKWGVNTVFENISFSVNKNSCVGIYGEIGSGKTTLLHCLTRLYDPPVGKVFYKGQDVLSLEPCELRKSIGYVLQGTHLFSGTIRENVLWGYKAEHTECLKAAEKASFLEDIQEFENGWDTRIGEDGVRLSGGQRQRLALARAFLRKPELFIFDDVMSAVDEKTSQVLMDNIFATGASVLIVSSRESVLKKCETVYRLHDHSLMKDHLYET